MANSERTYQFKALTDLWTGDLNGKSGRLIPTGLLGSIRWWFEVLVRGLSGNACDPSDTKCEGRNHCVVCELFGCTGWARKFRFEVLNLNENTGQTLILSFTPLRPICVEEWTLLNATLRLIAGYGAIGGKMVFKPTDEPSREKEKHHRDYGLVQMVSSQQYGGTGRDDLGKYLSKWRKLNHGEFAWASLEHFWCVKGKYLGREDNNKSTFNQVLGRQEAKNQGQQLTTHNDGIARWLAGSQRESKKVFSFKNPARTFGFVKPGLIAFDDMRERLAEAWGQNGWDFLTGDKILKQLFTGEEDRS
ncbi:MAG: type III-B CRISPR module RAMP protein Cmr1 [Treponema sp.]|nr:type III-B CRISPR module RAMP protein Cmr1 [Treponema sp.]